MNNTFSTTRFSNLITRRFVSNYNSIIRTMIITASIPVLLLLISFITQDVMAVSYSLRFSILKLTLFAVILASPFAYYGNLNHPKKGLNSVMLPASILEKYLEMQLFCLIIFPIIFIFPYIISDSIISILLPTQSSVSHGIVDLLFIRWDSYLNIFISAQIVIFCNLYFIKHKVIKTILANILIVIALSLLNIFLFRIIYANIFSLNEATPFSLHLTRSLIIRPDDNIISVIVKIERTIYYTILPIALLAGSYLRMKTQKY